MTGSTRGHAARAATPRVARRTAAALVGLALVVAPGCSQGADRAGPTEPSRATEQADADEQTAEPEHLGPAQAYISLMLGVTEESGAAQAIRAEEVVADCMAEAGFEYAPSTSGYVFAGHDEGETQSREFAELFGYGWANVPDEWIAIAAPRSDPNAAMVAAMSEAEAAAYMAALWGTFFLEHLDGLNGEEPEWTDLGCNGRAQHEVWDAGAVSDATYLALKDEVERIDAELVPAHPDVVAADAAWSACMADAGYPGLERQPDAEARAYQDYLAATTTTGAWIENQSEVDREERHLATADWDCRDQAGYDAIVTPVRDRFQQEYVNAHRDELDAWVERWAER